MLLICPMAGAGTRLMPFTYSKPKAFIKVAGKRVIDHILIKLQKTFPKGTNLCIIVGYKKRQMSEYVSKHYSKYFNINYVEQKPLGYKADAPYFSGLGDAILLAKDHGYNDDCFIFLSDRLPMEDYSQILLKYHEGNCDGVLNVRQVDNPKIYGVVELNSEGHATGVEEKPSQPKSNYAISGAYFFGKRVAPKIFDLLAQQSQVPLDNGKERQFTPIIQQIIEEGYKLKINEMRDTILDFGRPEGLLEANRLLLSEIKNPDPIYEKYVQSGSIKDSKIIPPVFIGDNTKICNSVIGPNVSIGDDDIIDKCILSETVVGDGARLTKIITSSSIIGDYSILEDLIKREITIGDSSVIATSKMTSS